MRVLLAVLALPAALAAQTPAASVAAAPADTSVVGSWLGSVTAGGMRLRLGLNLRAAPGGKLVGTLDSFDQGMTGLPIEKVVLAGDTLRLAMAGMQATFQGTLSSDRRTLTGTWRQGVDMPLVLHRGDSAARAAFAVRKRPQEPKAPFPYAVQEVTIPSVPGVTLAGTLTLPKGEGPHPAVVLVSGSGPQDRDEQLLGHRPFLVLADYLTRRGIAVLRYDDRGVGRSTGRFATATSEDFAADARAAVAFLRKRPDVASGKVGIAGHSEGGLIAPMVARDPAAGVGFVVMLAGPGVRGDSILVAQGDLIARAMGTADSVRTRNLAASRRIYGIIAAERDSAALLTQVRAATRDLIAAAPGARGTPDSMMVEVQARQLTTPWFRYFLTYDPQPTLRAVKVPVLAVNGTLDLQVPYEDNLAAIKAALSAGGNRDHTELALRGLNHLFQTTKTGSPAEYADIEETFAPSALQVIGDWIVERVGQKR